MSLIVTQKHSELIKKEIKWNRINILLQDDEDEQRRYMESIVAKSEAEEAEIIERSDFDEESVKAEADNVMNTGDPMTYILDTFN